MMLGIHSKIIFSVFAASELKRRIEKENLKHQYGTKPAGAEAIVHTFQQLSYSSKSRLWRFFNWRSISIILQNTWKY